MSPSRRRRRGRKGTSRHGTVWVGGGGGGGSTEEEGEEVSTEEIRVHPALEEKGGRETNQKKKSWRNQVGREKVEKEGAQVGALPVVQLQSSSPSSSYRAENVRIQPASTSLTHQLPILTTASS